MTAPPITEQQRMDLRRVQVRPIVPSELERWNTLLRAHHYRGFRTLAGQTLRYVATIEERWVALLGWQSGVLHCAARDDWIGWSGPLLAQRLHLIANNGRFLVLPEASFPNLASRILSLNLRRLSSDWQAAYGHSIVLAETFVEVPRFRGTCYRAANWIDVGWTRGFSRNPGGKGYTYHGQRKRVLVYPFTPQARTDLTRIPPPLHWNLPMFPATRLTRPQWEALRELLRQLPDPRSRLGRRYSFLSTLTLAIAAIVAGCKSYVAIAEWVQRLPQKQRQRIGCRYNPQDRRYEVPSETAIRRLLQAMNADALDATLGAWFWKISGKKAIAVDGKTLKGAVREEGSPVQLLSAFLHGEGAVVAQREIAVKTNEIPEVRNLLRDLDLQGTTVTADALHTQRATAKFLVEEKKAHYLFTAVKGNQKSLRDELTCLDWRNSPPAGRNL
ncbi:MAG: ISAs1 family transposase [Acidithiobacillus sp.]